MRVKFFKFISVCFLGTLFSKEVFSQEINTKSKDLKFEIEDITYDDQKSIIYSTGGIRIYKEDLEMTADYFEFNSKDDTFSLVGDVEFDAQDNFFKLNSLVSSSDMSNVHGKTMEGFSSDGGHMVADSLGRENSYKNVFRGVDYTACDIGFDVEDFKKCQKKVVDGKSEDKEKEVPAWSLYSGRLVQDTDAEMLYAYNNIFYLWDFPVFYLPYMAYPSFDVKRKTGLLPFEFGKKNYGSYISTPLFIDISDHEDMTLKPIFTKDEGLLSGMEYRRKLTFGNLFFDGYYINEKTTDDQRWYVNSRNEFTLTDVWKLDLDIRRASDDTFSKKYDITHNDWLTSNIETGAYWDSNYFILGVTSYQDLRYYEDSSDGNESPEVMPQMYYYYETDVSDEGTFWSFDSSLVNLWTNRNSYQNVEDSYNTRFSFDLKRHYKDIFDNGIVADTSLALKSDFYFMDDIYYGEVDPSEVPESGNEFRIYPELNVLLKYPLFKKGKSFSSIIEPVVQAIISPDNSRLHDSDILNMDSLDTELDENNLFSDNRYRGSDLIETGNRFNAGVNWDVMFDDSEQHLSMFFGQGYVDSSENIYPEGSGLREGFTDAVGSVKFKYSSSLDFYYRFRLDGDNYEFNRNDLGFRSFQKNYWIDMGYIYSAFVDETSTSDDDRTEEVRAMVKTKLTDNWNLTGGSIYNLSTSSLSEWEMGVEFVNDCLGIGLIADRKNSNDRDYKGSTSFSIKISFRNTDGNKSEEVLRENGIDIDNFNWEKDDEFMW
ncbi:MAG: LPS assembly protein LptD [Alphaproteobacteria bacterium]|jgi:LPS-assembly protein|nr:LPS assembly protein LptD [Alphaproteobacteria bacterium]